MKLQPLLATSDRPAEQQALFALLALGVIESLANGVLGASDAVRLFFNADNCLFVRKRLLKKSADEVMSRGDQLPDLFDALPTEEAYRAFQHELATMRRALLEVAPRETVGGLKHASPQLNEVPGDVLALPQTVGIPLHWPCCYLLQLPHEWKDTVVGPPEKAQGRGHLVRPLRGVKGQSDMTPEEMEQRVMALESAVSELQHQLATLAPPGNWLEKVIGSVTDDEAFAQVLEYGRAFRAADRPPDEPGDKP